MPSAETASNSCEPPELGWSTLVERLTLILRELRSDKLFDLNGQHSRVRHEDLRAMSGWLPSMLRGCKFDRKARPLNGEHGRPQSGGISDWWPVQRRMAAVGAAYFARHQRPRVPATDLPGLPTSGLAGCSRDSLVGMVRKVETVVTLTDDLDGTKADRTMSFAVDGTTYEIDLSKRNAAAFQKVLAPYLDAARKVKQQRGRRRATSSSGRRSDLADVRAWARANGYEISDRGRIPASVTEAYQAAH